MVIVDTTFKLNVLSLLSKAGFVSENSNRHYNYMSHKNISRFMLEYREFHGRITIGLSGVTINSSRKVDYHDDDPKALINLKSRLNRLVKKELDHEDQRVKRYAKNKARKAKIANLVDDFNDRKGGHSIVLDPESLEDDYSIVSAYYRSYELDIKVDEEYGLYTRQTLLNKPMQELSLYQFTDLVNVLKD